MSALFSMLRNVSIFVLLTIPGYILVKKKILSANESKTVSKLMTNVGMPFLILSSTLNIKLSGEFIGKMVFTAFMGIALLFGTFIITALLICKNDDEKKKRMARFCMVFPNNGFLGIPLAEAVFGASSNVMTYLIILNILNNVMMFTLGIYLISGDKKAIKPKKILLNPLVIAFVLGIVLNILDVKSYVPELISYSAHLKGLVTPLSMTVLGIRMAEINLGDVFKEKSLYRVSVIKLLIFPIVCVGTIFVLKLVPVLGINSDMIFGFFMAFAMPTAGLASPFADQYDGDMKNSVVYTLGTTLLSVVTISVLYGILCVLI